MIRSCVGLSSFKALGGLAAVLLAVPSFGAVITFDDIPVGTTYQDGQSFNTSDTTITVHGGASPRVPLPPGNEEPLISAGIRERPSDLPSSPGGGMGNWLLISAAGSADFDFGNPIAGLYFEMSSVLGVGLIVNGDSTPDRYQYEDSGGGVVVNFEIGGVQVRQIQVDGAPANTRLIGDIESFTIIGRGGAVDSFITSEAIPEPGSLSLLLAAGGLLIRRRRS